MINNFKIVIDNYSKFNLTIKITIIFYLTIKIINEKSLLSNNLIIRDSLKSSFIAIIKINKRYRLMRNL